MYLSAEEVAEFADEMLARLTPNGGDEVCHLQTDIGPTDVAELRDRFAALRAALVT
ncbi:hypothetical protein [Kitasatospora sp. DSM 101779]|uniref:hypothetical protein n=1 Tax=Kitasatospora sp. DSM 101779 TaxID=2853165 RepID=UPI0021DAD64C|nr:hypothetical protein [Kitasatospora sp. DSM 101779]MCU7820479.1 hypothetical protein [Kitasatospora sp. DSM 101779]